MPLFSIVLATRDRPALFREALQSVMSQASADLEIVVVNDGTAAAHLEAYRQVIDEARQVLGERLKFFSLVHRPQGHGQSYSLNYGAAQASGDYLAFLDDDDCWTDSQHLSRVAALLVTHPGADLLMFNQAAFAQGVRRPGPIWLDALVAELQASGRSAGSLGEYAVDIADLLQTHGFCHINCLLVRREHYLAIRGMDEGIRWECDHDLFLRLIDAAALMVHHPAYVSRHNIPDASKQNNMTTSISMIEKRLYQLRVFDKAALFAHHAAIRRYGLRNKCVTLKKIAEELAALGRWRSAAAYARAALGTVPSFKWMVWSAYCSLRGLVSGDPAPR